MKIEIKENNIEKTIQSPAESCKWYSEPSAADSTSGAKPDGPTTPSSASLAGAWPRMVKCKCN